MYSKLIVAWRNPKTRAWIPVGSLKYEDNKYFFHYTNGAKSTEFIPFGKLEDKNEVYESDTLFPIFLNRLLSKSRPEYEDYLNWLDIEIEKNNPLLELSRSRGIRATDELQLFPLPEKNQDGNYEVLFFSHGISHMSDSYTKRISTLHENEKLLILQDVQNEYDKNALLLRTKSDPVELLGYCPAFFVKDFQKIMKINGNSNVTVQVKKINYDAPLQLKLLCKFTAKWPDGFISFDSAAFQKYKIINKNAN